MQLKIDSQNIKFFSELQHGDLYQEFDSEFEQFVFMKTRLSIEGYKGCSVVVNSTDSPLYHSKSSERKVKYLGRIVYV